MDQRSERRPDALSRREQDVARLMARGLTNGQIADELGITFATAKWHVSQVITKLGASSREEAAATWHAEQRVSTRLTRALAGLASVAALRTAAIVVLVALVAAGIGGLLLVFLQADDEATPANTDATPTLDASATPAPTPTTAAALSPCDPANLINGFLVLAEDEPVPDCVGREVPIATDGKAYELAVSPGPYAQTPIDDREHDGSFYTRSDLQAPAFAVYRQKWVDLPGRVIRGASPVAVDFLPGDGIQVQRADSKAYWWVESNQTFGFEIFADGSGLSPEKVASLLVYFDPLRQTATYWDSASRAFRAENRPPWLYPQDVDTGVPSITEIVRVFAEGNRSLVPFVDTVQMPCVTNPVAGPLVPPTCPPGQPEGTLVASLLVGGCPDGEWGALDPSISGFFEQGAPQPVWLYAIATAGDLGIEGLEYVAAFTTGERVFSLALTDSGVAGVGGSGCATPELATWAATVDTWLLPPLYPLPSP